MEETTNQLPDQIKKKIDLEMENSRFYQTFFIPTLTGLITLFLVYKNLDLEIVVLLGALGTLSIIILTLLRNRSIKRMKSFNCTTQ